MAAAASVLASGGGLRRKKKRRTRPVLEGTSADAENEKEEEEDDEEDAQTQETRDAEQRLAALGEAFLNSFDDGARPPARRKDHEEPKKKKPRFHEVTDATAADLAGLPMSEPATLLGSLSPGANSATKRRKRGQAPTSTTESSIEQDRGGTLPMSSRPSGVNSASSSSKPVAPSAFAAPAPSVLAPQKKMSSAERRRFMSGNVSDIHTKRIVGNAFTPKRGRQLPKETEEDAEFRKTLREVLDFVTPQLGVQERKQYETAKLRALGGTIDKSEKVPYHLLQKRAIKHKEQRKIALEEEKHMGVHSSVNNHLFSHQVNKLLQNKKEAIKDKKRRSQDGFIQGIGMGAREHRGEATISNRVIKEYKRGKKI